MLSNPLNAYVETFARRSDARTEADVHMAIAAFLVLAPLGLAEGHVTKMEQPTKDGTRRRIDISHGRLLIEVKRSLTSPAVKASGQTQLAEYLKVLESRDGHEYAGILTDGVIWYLYTLTPDGPMELDSHEVDADGDPQASERLRLWLETILLTGDKIKPTPELIAERLGTSSPRFKLDRARLGQLYYSTDKHPDVALKRHLWARLLRTALGTAFGDDPELFIDHTLLVLEAEVIAHLVVGLDPDKLSAKEIVAGESFRAAGIYNVVEADFFDWPAESPEGIDFIESLVRELSQFDWTDVEHDVLKVLYEAVIEQSVRKNLGEYYTPDWLAARVVSETITDPLNQKVMDPACGSGTFLFHAVRKFLAAADRENMPNGDALNLLQDRVFGMDIHPVSAVLARVTYLLAIGPERLADRDTLAVPVYLGDSMQWGRAAGTFGSSEIAIEVDSPDLATVDSASHDTLFSSGQQLKFPLASIDNPGHFDRLVDDLANLAQTYTDASKPFPTIRALLDTHGVTAKSERQTLTETFEGLCALNAEDRDHIWGYFVRNQIRPLWFSVPSRRMDVLVGNPPWIAYRFMTGAMQAQFKGLATTRNIWVGGKVTSTQDLVALFTVRTVEQFLKADGKFAFVTPLGVLSRLQFEGFRTGRWAQDIRDGSEGQSQSVNVAFSESWDLYNVPDIFLAPAAVIFGARAEEAVALPSTTIEFRGTPGALSESPGETVALTTLFGGGSEYGRRAFQGPTVVPSFLFFSEELPPSALGRPRGTTEVVSARSNQEKAPWKHLPDYSGPIESIFLKKVHSGTSIVPFRALDPATAVFPVADGALLEEREIGKYPLLKKRWQDLSSIWDANKKKKTKLTLMERLNYQKTFSKQLPVPSHRIVYNTSGTRLGATILNDPDTLISNRLYWLAMGSQDEANYLVAILNSAPFGAAVGRLQGLGLYGPRDFHTLPWRIPVPLFDTSNKDHLAMAELGNQAATIAESVDLPDASKHQEARPLVQDALASSGIQAKIDELVVSLIPTLEVAQRAATL